MDKDNLFVCFSPEACRNADGKPLFHDGIECFAKALTRETFQEFFEARYKWHWYPIWTRRMSTFSVHEDLPQYLRATQVLDGIGYASEICAREDGRRFISGLGLLALLCRWVEHPSAVTGLSDNFMAVRSGVTQNAIDPNIEYWFSKVASYQFKSGIVPKDYTGSFDVQGLCAPHGTFETKEEVQH